METVTTPKPFVSPDEELLAFANDFSEKCHSLKDGDYFSEKEKYHIRLMETIIHGNVVVRIGRISHKTKIIDINRQNLQSLTPDYFFYFILWCIAIVEVTAGDTMSADKLAIEYYLTTKRSVKNLLDGFSFMMGEADTPLNAERVNQLKQMLSRIESKNGTAGE